MTSKLTKNKENHPRRGNHYYQRSTQTCVQKATTSLVFAVNARADGVLDNGANVNVDGLIVAAESGGEVAEVLAVVGDVLAQHLEGDDAVLAVGSGGEQAEDAGLFHVGADVDEVASGVEDQVVDPEGAHFGLVDRVGEGDITLGICM